MELNNYINANEIRSHEDLKNILEKEPFYLNFKEDKDYPNLLLIHTTEKSDYNNIIVRECNGIIIEKENLKILCYTFDKCVDQNEESKIPDYIDKNNLYLENAVEGTLMRYFNYNGEWILSTKKCIDAKKARWMSTKSFYELFEDYMKMNGISIIDRLNPEYCYSFILIHPENNIVINYDVPFIYHISTRNMTTLKEFQTSIGISNIPRTYIENDKIEETIENLLNIRELNFEGYIFTDTNYNRWKIRTLYFNRARELWGNTNNRIFRYMELRKDNELLHEYLMYFPQDRNIFLNFEYKLKLLASDILKYYVEKHITKKIEKVPYYYVKIIYRLHGDFYKNKVKTDLNKVGLTLLEIDAKQLCFILNHYEKDINTVKDENMDVDKEL